MWLVPAGQVSSEAIKAQEVYGCLEQAHAAGASLPVITSLVRRPLLLRRHQESVFCNHTDLVPEHNTDKDEITVPCRRVQR